MTNSEYQRKRAEKAATMQGLTYEQYKAQCDKNTAAHKGMTLSEYTKFRIESAAARKGMTKKEYIKEVAEKTARNKGFRNKKDYDNAGKRAKVLHMTKEAYCKTPDKDSNGYYILPTLKKGKPKDYSWVEGEKYER